MNVMGKRSVERFPYKHPLMYVVLGHGSHPPEAEAATSEIMDLSDNGMRMRIRGRKFPEGSLLLVRVPVSRVPVAVPSLAQVRWIREETPGAYEAGLRFVIE
jgi:PilZ domain